MRRRPISALFLSEGTVNTVIRGTLKRVIFAGNFPLNAATRSLAADNRNILRVGS